MIKPVFNISLHSRDEEILKLIQAYFTDGPFNVVKKRIIGSIYKTANDRVCFSVNSLQQISEVLIPHFEEYPVITNQKRDDYLIFKEVIWMVTNQEHLFTQEGLQRIIALNAAYLNKGGGGLPDKFSKIRPYSSPAVYKIPVALPPE